MWRWLRWVLLGIVILMVGLFAILWFVMGWQFSDIDINNPPQFLNSDFIELDKVSAITKYRSGWGHNYAANGETCRSMKHEFMFKKPAGLSEFEKKEQELKKSGLTPSDEDISNLKRGVTHNDNSPYSDFYSPVDGRVMSIGESSGVGNEIEISVNGYPGWRIRMYHVYINTGVHRLSSLKAGQVIGKGYLDIGWGDIAIEYRYFGGKRLVSYFQVMPDRIFAKYQARGVNNRSDLIISKEYRDADPLQCLNNHGETSDYAKNYTATAAGYNENVFTLN